MKDQERLELAKEAIDRLRERARLSEEESYHTLYNDTDKGFVLETLESKLAQPKWLAEVLSHDFEFQVNRNENSECICCDGNGHVTGCALGSLTETLPNGQGDRYSARVQDILSNSMYPLRLTHAGKHFRVIVQEIPTPPPTGESEVTDV